MDNLKDALVPAALTAVGTTIGTSFFLGASSRFEKPLFGTQISEPLAYGLLGGGAKLVAELSKDSILPYISENGTVMGIANLGTPLVTGGSLVGLNYLSLGENDLNSTELMKLFAIGTASDYAASYAGEQLNLM